MKIIILILLLYHARNETKDSLLNRFFDNYIKADKDDMIYYITQFNLMGFNDLEKIFQDPEALSNFYYLNKQPKGYIVTFPNKIFFLYSIFVNIIYLDQPLYEFFF
jgi:hypothetical protein